VNAISFARGFPGPDLLPVEELGECARAALAHDGATALNYGPPGGYGPLREWIAERHATSPARVMITNGSLQGFNFAARHFVERGATFFVEAPCYDRSLNILRRFGAGVEEVPLVELGHRDQAAMLMDFMRALRAGEAAPTTAADNLRSLEMVFAAVESARQGREIPLS
jgi:DNA-binding transcriptional MocR family regulator